MPNDYTVHDLDQFTASTREMVKSVEDSITRHLATGEPPHDPEEIVAQIGRDLVAYISECDDPECVRSKMGQVAHALAYIAHREVTRAE